MKYFLGKQYCREIKQSEFERTRRIRENTAEGPERGITTRIKGEPQSNPGKQES